MSSSQVARRRTFARADLGPPPDGRRRLPMVAPSMVPVAVGASLMTTWAGPSRFEGQAAASGSAFPSRFVLGSPAKTTSARAHRVSSAGAASAGDHIALR